MTNMLMGPLCGVVVVATLTGIVTVGCWVAMFKMLLRPGERDPHHPKYLILRADR